MIGPLPSWRRRAVALAVAACFVAACSPSWPRPVATVDQRLAGHAAGVARVDVLPIDLAVWTDGRHGDPEALRLIAEYALADAATTALYERGYVPGAQVRWDGTFTGDDGVPRAALAPDELLATVAVLAGYHDAAVRLGGLPQPPLPARLGASGAEATLYVGGWAFVGDDPAGDNTALKVLVIAAVVVVAIVVAVALSKSKSKGRGGLARAADAVADAAVATGRVAAHGLARVGDVAFTVGRTSAHLADHLLRTFGPHRAAHARPADRPDDRPARPVWGRRLAAGADGGVEPAPRSAAAGPLVAVPRDDDDRQSRWPRAVARRAALPGLGW